MHYDVDRNTLQELATKIEELSLIERKVCSPEKAECKSFEQKRCHIQRVSHKCSNEVNSNCYKQDREEV